MKLSQEQIDKLCRIVRWIALGILFGGFIILLILPKGTSSWPVWTWLGSSMFLGIVYNIIKHWATDEEAEEFKKAVKEAVREEREDELRKKRKVPFDECIKSPLKGLTPQQEQVIIDLLCNKILVENNRLKTSELKHLLKALQLQGDLDDSNMDHVIAWVEQVSGYEVDDRNLKYDYVAKFSDKKITKWGDIIRERYKQIEIS